MLLLIPLNIVRQNQYSFKKLKIKRKRKKRNVVTYFSVELYLPIRLLILLYRYLKMYSSLLKTVIHFSLSTVLGVFQLTVSVFIQ